MFTNLKIKIPIVILVCMIIAYIGYFIAINSEPYTYAVNYIENNEGVIPGISESVTVKYLDILNYSYEYDELKGSANLVLVLQKPHSGIKVYIKLTKSYGSWSMDDIKLVETDPQDVESGN